MLILTNLSTIHVKQPMWTLQGDIAFNFSLAS